MKSKNYLKRSLETDTAINDLFSEDCDKLLSYHSYSPQYIYYKDCLVYNMENYLYQGYLDKQEFTEIMNRIKNNHDTEALHLVAPVLNLLYRFKPRLKLIDLLYDIDLERTYILQMVSRRMNRVFKSVDNFSSLYGGRVNLVLSNIEKAYNTKDSKNRECYYYLNLAKNALNILTKYYRTDCNEFIDLYVEVCNEIYSIDKDFYEEYYNSFLDDSDNDITPNISSGSLSDSNLFSRVNKDSTNIDSQGIKSESKSNVSYSYLDFLIDYNDLLKSLSSNSYNPKTDFYTKKVLDSDMPFKLKDKCSKMISDLYVDYTLENFEISNCFIWYDVVQDDFIYYLNAKDFNESKIVVNTFDELLTEDNLVDFYVNKAYMASIPDEGDALTYNVCLIDSLEKLQSYGFISDVSHYFNLYRR